MHPRYCTAMPADVHGSAWCPIHRCDKHLHRQGPGRAQRYRCQACRAAYRKRVLERREARLRRSVLQSDSEAVLQRADALAAAVGGWSVLLERLSADQATALAVKLAGAADELRQRAESIPAAVSQAAQDRATVAAAAELLLAMQPIALRPVLERLTLRARDKRGLHYADGGGI